MTEKPLADNRREPGKPRFFQIAFERGDAVIHMPRQMQRYEVEALRQWMELVLRTVERTALDD